MDSGLRKFGAVLGDGCQTGCNTVLNPGTIAAPGCLFYPSVVAVGYFGPRTIVRGPVSVADTDGGDAAA